MYLPPLSVGHSLIYAFSEEGELKAVVGIILLHLHNLEDVSRLQFI